jgi:hypothetical protein
MFLLCSSAFSTAMQGGGRTPKPHRNTLLSVFFDPMDLIRLVNFKNPVA